MGKAKHRKMARLTSVDYLTKNSERNLMIKHLKKILPSGNELAIKEYLNYKMPQGYIAQETLIGVGLFCTSILRKDVHYLGNKIFQNSIKPFCHFFTSWFVKDQPLYCVTNNLVKALIETDILQKFDILKNLHFAFKQFLIALPNDTIAFPGHDSIWIDFLLITLLKTSQNNCPQIISISYMDTNSSCWTFNTEIKATGEIEIPNKINGGESIDCTNEIKSFENKVLSLTLNILLLLEYSGDSILVDVLPSETVQESRKLKGLREETNTLPPKYPRWIGKDYKIKFERSPNVESGTHASPRTHWRRGHWRCIEPGEGKHWKESKRLWIEPILINAGAE